VQDGEVWFPGRKFRTGARNVTVLHFPELFFFFLFLSHTSRSGEVQDGEVGFAGPKFWTGETKLHSPLLPGFRNKKENESWEKCKTCASYIDICIISCLLLIHYSFQHRKDMAKADATGRNGATAVENGEDEDPAVEATEYNSSRDQSVLSRNQGGKKKGENKEQNMHRFSGRTWLTLSLSFSTCGSRAQICSLKFQVACH
jgi:hypothetical protein